MRWTGWGPWNLRKDMAVSSLHFLFALYISRWALEKPTSWKCQQVQIENSPKKGSGNGLPNRTKTFFDNTYPTLAKGHGNLPIPTLSASGN